MLKSALNRSDLIEFIMTHNALPLPTAENVVNTILTEMSKALAQGQRIEIRDFGSFEIRTRAARKARNPKTGEAMLASAKKGVHFKPGKALKERVINKVN